MAVDSWLTRFIDNLKSTKKTPESLSTISPPELITFTFEYRNRLSTGIIFWAFENEWNNCGGGNGFELGLSHNKLRVRGLDGSLVSDIKYTLPSDNKTTPEVYDISLKFDLDRFACTIAPRNSPNNRVRLQVLTQIPSRLNVGTGSPPGAENGVPEDSIAGFTVLA